MTAMEQFTAGRAMRRIGLMALLVALPISLNGQSTVLNSQSPVIGKVSDLEGMWCRVGVSLKSGDPLHRDDDVRYCSPRLSSMDWLEVRYDGNPSPRTYRCSTPGVCDLRARLWLRGGAEFAKGAPAGFGTLLISRPNIRNAASGGEFLVNVVPDAVVRLEAAGAKLPTETLKNAPDGRWTICRLAPGRLTDCTTYQVTPASPFVRLQRGLYGMYRQVPADPSTQPDGLLLVSPPGSDAPERWQDVPEPFRVISDVNSVNERRSFLLQLYRSQQP